MSESVMSLLFGKKPKKRSSRKRTTKSSSGKKVTRKKIGYTCKKGRIVHVYKYKGLTGRRYSNKRKLAKGKKVHKTKAAAKAALRKMSKKAKKTTRRRTKKSNFGVGGSYMPLESFMSPYPYAVDSSPPWV